MNKELNVVIENHPYSRSYNWLGGCEDIKSHNWVHCNIKFITSPECYAPIKDAFSSPEAFKILCWDANDKVTASISRWTLRDSPVASQEGHSLWLSFESLGLTPDNFLTFIADKFDIKIRLTYYLPYSSQPKQKFFVPNLKD
jgi:hypothetical protein